MPTHPEGSVEATLAILRRMQALAAELPEAPDPLIAGQLAHLEGRISALIGQLETAGGAATLSERP